MSRPLSTRGEAEERHIEAMALRYELQQNDLQEIRSYQRLWGLLRDIADRNGDGSLDRRDALLALDELQHVILRDRRENQLHRSISPAHVRLEATA